MTFPYLLHNYSIATALIKKAQRRFDTFTLSRSEKLSHFHAFSLMRPPLSSGGRAAKAADAKREVQDTNQ